MNNQEKVAAWLGLFGLIGGIYVFAVFVAPKLLSEYGNRMGVA